MKVSLIHFVILFSCLNFSERSGIRTINGVSAGQMVGPTARNVGKVRDMGVLKQIIGNILKKIMHN